MGRMGGTACGLAQGHQQGPRQARGGQVATYYYHRATGTRLVGEPGTPEFVASFPAAAKSMVQDRGAGTLAWLIRQ